MKVLMIGGTGIISSDITALAGEKESVDLYLLNRGIKPRFFPGSVKTIQADIHDREDVEKKLKSMSFDVVADFISFDVEELKHKIDIFRGRCGQYIFISSVAVYRTPLNFHVITEDNTALGNPQWLYGLNKTLCERHLAEEYARSGMQYTVVRPAYTYNNIRILHPYTISHWLSWTIAHRLLEGKPYVLHDDGQQFCTAMHALDFAEAFIGLWGNPAAKNECFHITSSEYLTWKRIAELTAEALDTKIKFCLVPAEELCLELAGESRDTIEKLMAVSHHAVYDNSKIRQAVPGFDCKINFKEGIKRTIQFYLDHPEYQKIDERWDAIFDRITERFYEKNGKV
jgi:nucleoside-diphosphate-sugar epimerase